MNKIFSRLRDERLLLLLGYCFSTLNFFILKYVNTALLANRNEVLTIWMPVMRLFSIAASVLMVIALFTFIFKKAPRYKWIGYAFLFMTILSISFISTNSDLFIVPWKQAVYAVMNLLHMALNFTIASLMITYSFCNKKSFNSVIALKLISTSLLMGMPILELLSSRSVSHGISSILSTTDTILKFVVIVVLLMSLTKKKEEFLSETTQ